MKMENYGIVIEGSLEAYGQVEKKKFKKLKI